MRTTIKKRGHRVSFYVPDDWLKKLNSIILTDEHKKTISEFSREALIQKIEAIEQEKLEKELAEGYQANFDYYLNEAKAWEYVDNELPS
ncbi:MAG: hypothetical protein ACM3MI_10555 [Clostridiales bacterium]